MPQSCRLPPSEGQAGAAHPQGGPIAVRGHPFVHVFWPSPASLQGRISWSPASPSSLLLILLHNFPLLSSCCADTKPVTRGPEVYAEPASVPACRLPRCLPASSPVPISLILVAWICSQFGGYDGVGPWREPGHAGQEAAGSLVGEKPKT